MMSFASSVLQPPDEPHPREDTGGFMSPFSTPQSSQPHEWPPASRAGTTARQVAVTVTKEDGPTVGLHLTMKSGPGGVYYVIDHVAPGSVASAKGLKVGDRVLSVQGQEAKHISGDQVTHYMMQRPLHMVTLTEDRLEFQPPSSPASSLAARPPADQSHVQPAVDDAATRYKEERDEAARSLETERSTRQAVEAELNEERTARHAVEGQLRELMSQAQSLQAVNGELRRALEALEAAQRHQANAATTARTMQTAVSAPLADKPASPAPTRAATTVSSATSAPRKYHATSTRRHFSCPLWVWM